MKKYYATFILLVALSSLSSCGEVVQGFIAPAGATINTPPDTSIETESGGTLIFTFSIFKDDIPLNNVQATINCFNCEILDAPTEPRYPNVDNFDTYEVVQPDPALHIIRTASNGTYTVLIDLPSPLLYNPPQYTAEVGINAGTETKVVKIEVKVPDAGP